MYCVGACKDVRYVEVTGVSMISHKIELKMIFIGSYVKSELRLRFFPLLLVFVVA